MSLAELVITLVVGVGVGLSIAGGLALLRPVRFGCPRCTKIIGDAWALGAHLAECGRPPVGRELN